VAAAKKSPHNFAAEMNKHINQVQSCSSAAAIESAGRNGFLTARELPMDKVKADVRTFRHTGGPQHRLSAYFWQNIVCDTAQKPAGEQKNQREQKN
jgi:hypothetical protein